MATSIHISAVGDISFEGPQANNPSPDCFSEVSGIFQKSDLVVGNLESALIQSGDPIRGKCTLRGNPGWASVMRDAGIGLVSLANNHVMDYGKQGLFSTIEALDLAGIRHVGAGGNVREACAPLFVDTAGRRVAFLGRSAVIVGALTYAGENDPGVAFLDALETAATIRSCRPQADLVILLVHWGLEEYSYPSPTQRQLARQFVDAGADVILGHHPHVPQGFEYYRSSLILYSLGNFAFNEFEWTAISDSVAVKQVAKLSLDNRKAIIAALKWNGAERPAIAIMPARIEPNGRVRVDADPARGTEMEVLSRKMLKRGYDLWWRLYAIRREWSLRLGHRISVWRILTNLHRLRPRHLKNLFDSLRRSVRIVREKTTNPYH